MLIWIFLIWLYTNSLVGVNPISKDYLQQLKEEVEKEGYEADFFVISGKRWKVDNFILNKIGQAVPNSQHLKGNAIDILVLDVNDDGQSNAADVDIIYRILDEKIIRDNGGVGTYKKAKCWHTRQMVHFDCRGIYARWHR